MVACSSNRKFIVYRFPEANINMHDTRWVSQGQTMKWKATGFTEEEKDEE
jgi:hypothetical protein